MTASGLQRCRRRLRAALIGAAVALSACSGPHNVLNPAGPQADRIRQQWWVLFAVCAFVYAAVVVVLLATVAGRRRPMATRDDPIREDPAIEWRLGRFVLGAVLITTVLIFVLSISDFFTGRALSSVAPGDHPVTIKVIGHQWWWELNYEPDTPTRTVTTANEMHVPIGRTIQLKLTSSDVIHSFWAPNINGKRDLIPGQINTMAFTVARPGTYRAPCAEFCGLQHALMHMLVIAEPEAQFTAWLAHERDAGAVPSTPQQARGQQVFMTAQCSMCHRIGGTDAGGTVAPDLTHVAARQTLAAGALPNSRGHLAGWIVDPQRIKPGTNMPMNPLSPDDLQALLDYLQALH